MIQLEGHSWTGSWNDLISVNWHSQGGKLTPMLKSLPIVLKIDRVKLCNYRELECCRDRDKLFGAIFSSLVIR